MSHSLDSRAGTLTRGQPVFLLGYHDEKLRHPFVEAFVFLGTQQAADGTTTWHFQPADAFLEAPVTDLAQAGDDEVFIVDREGLGTFVDWAGLVAELQEGLARQ